MIQGLTLPPPLSVPALIMWKEACLNRDGDQEESKQDSQMSSPSSCFWSERNDDAEKKAGGGSDGYADVNRIENNA